MLAVKRSVGVASEMDLMECTLHSPLQKQIRQNPLWLSNPEETSLEIQNWGTSGPKIGHVYVSTKNISQQQQTKILVGNQSGPISVCVNEPYKVGALLQVMLGLLFCIIICICSIRENVSKF